MVIALFGIKEDSPHGRGFKGPSARIVLKNAHLLATDPSLPRELACFADALSKFNTVVSGCFGTGLEASFNYPAEILSFEKAFLKLGISITPKVHAVIAHLPKWLDLGKGPLGNYSEQATESCHYDFLNTLKNYSYNPQ